MKRFINCLLLILTITLLIGCNNANSEKLLEECADKISVEATAEQDFYLVRTIEGFDNVYISWTSSNPEVIKVGNLATIDGVSHFTAKVVLPVEETTVKLTALLETADGSKTFEKTFDVKVPARPAEGKWKSVSFAIDEANKLDGSTNQKSSEKYLISGTVKEIVKEEYCNFNLTDGNQTILVYGLYTADGKKSYGTKEGKEGMPIKVGDVVYLYTNLTNFGGTLELTSAWLVDENYEPTTTPTDYETKTIAEAITIAKSLNGDSQETTDEYYYVTGTVVNITKEEYCNFNLTDGTNTILVYGITNESGAKYGTNAGFLGIPIKAGDTVKLRTQIQNYKGTPELKNAVLVSVTEGTGPTVDVKQVTVAEALAMNTDVQVKIVGTVTTVLAKGFIITDATGSMNVFGTATVTQNQKVEIVGATAKYYDLPQISLATVEVVGEEKVTINYTKYEYANLPTNFKEPNFYATYVEFEGEVVETTDLGTPYVIMPAGSQKGFLISKYTNEAALAELKANVGKYVTVKAVVYDSKDSEWRFAYQEGTIAEATAPELTNEEKFAYVKAELEKEFNGINVRNNITLPTTGKYDTTISWTSNNEAISSTGEFKAPSEEVEVTLTATVKNGDTTIGTVEIKVKAKPAAQAGVAGPTYEYAFASAVFKNDSADQTAELGTLNWRLVHDGGYLGFDTANGRGLQVGSKKAPAANISLSTEDYDGEIQKISITACGASGISASAKVVIKIDGVEVGSDAITKEMTTYTYDCVAQGKIEIIVTGADKAFYISSISINK